jgi:uncharacterized membrane protein
MNEKSAVPVQLIVSAFNNEDAANEALNALKKAKKEKLIAIKDAAVLYRDDNDKLHIKEQGDLTGGQGALFGGALGLTWGILTGPGALLAGAAGAAIGGLASKLIDSGFDDERLKTIGESLKPGTSAIVALVEHKWVDELARQMKEAGADVFTASISEEITKQLAEGKDMAFSALSADGIVDLKKVVVGGDSVQTDSVTITDDGVSASTVTVTENGVSGATMVTDGVNAVGAAFEGTVEAEEGAEENPEE